MSRWAQIDTQTNIVENVVEWDGNEQTWQPPDGYLMWPDDGQQASPGFIYDPEKHTFTPPEIQPSNQVTSPAESDDAGGDPTMTPPAPEPEREPEL